jgi:hypothetical protein
MAATPAAGQSTSTAGSWVLDVRGTTSGVPIDVNFYPPLTAAAVPSRGFGADVGAHVYLFSLGPARVGLGASVMMVRATANAPVPTETDSTDTLPGQRLTLTMRALAPQISFNFGSRDGWSYLSAGLGTGSVSTHATDTTPDERKSGSLRAVNFGGGARWFITPRMAFSLDLRAHQFAAGQGTPRVSVFAVSAGISVR